MAGLWGFGTNECGCLGALDSSSVPFGAPIRLPAWTDVQPRQAVASAYATYVVTQSGDLVYTGMGIDEDGAMNKPALQPKPMPIRDDSKVGCIAGGLAPSHLLLRTSGGDILHLSLRQIGRGRDRHVEPSQEKLTFDSGNTTAHNHPDTLAVGYSHSLVTTQQGEVFSFGYAKCGRLGHPDLKDRAVPCRIESFASRKVTSVSCGFNFSLVLLQEGQVLSFGDGYFGQLGHGDTNRRLTPTPVTSLQSKVTAISAGKYHSVLLLEDSVITFGHKDACIWEEGYQEVDHQLRPKKIPKLAGLVAISAGGAHSLGLDKQGQVWLWGSNTLGALGQEQETLKIAPTRVPLHQRAVSITAGLHHSVIVISGEGTRS